MGISLSPAIDSLHDAVTIGQSLMVVLLHVLPCYMFMLH